ncbi:MAG: hypothetical protein COA53_08530 [Rhodobacteraceae bacterium]|nr:MAG: hypothetical protein COA53_08530 [Paracoccaceae bacterium]
MPDNAPAQSPTLAQEQERLRKWREVRRQAAADPNTERLRQADTDRKTRLDRFETEKADRIRTAENRRREEAEAIEARRMDKARAHLEALDDIETARASLIAARRKSRRLTGVLLAIFVGLPTLLTAVLYLFIAVPVFQSTSIFAVEGAMPATPRNPLFNTVSAEQSTMATAFQLRTQLQAQGEPSHKMAIDTTQGLLTITTSAPTPTEAYTQITDLLKTADALVFPAQVKILAQPVAPERATTRVLPNTLLAFLISLSLFSISGIFFQSFRHYVRN